MRPIFSEIIFLEFQEKTASISDDELFLNLYSIAPAGRLELSASVGINGLHPVTSTASGISLSSRDRDAKGKRGRNRPFLNRGRP